MLFHTTFARFPDKPTAEESQALLSYVHLFQRLYPWYVLCLCPGDQRQYVLVGVLTSDERRQWRMRGTFPIHHRQIPTASVVADDGGDVGVSCAQRGESITGKGAI